MSLELILKTKNETELPKPSQVVVSEKLGQPTTFSISYSSNVCEQDFLLLKNPALNPLQDVWISIKPTNKNEEIYLVKGFIQAHQIKVAYGGQGSTLQVNGTDNSAKLDWETRKKAWDGEKWGKFLDKEEVKGIFKNDQHTFRKFSILKNAQRSMKKNEDDNPKESEKNPTLKFKEKIIQKEGDLTFLKRLATQYGMYVWVSYDKEGKEVAHFDELPLNKEELLRNDPKLIRLIVNGGEKNNIDELSINWDANRPTRVESSVRNVKTKKNEESNTDESPQHKLGKMTLKQLTAGQLSEHLSGPPDNPGKRKRRTEAALNEAEWFIKASCSTSFDRLCKIVHAHTIVNVLGAGSRYDGPYLVAGVTHTISGDSHKMQIELKRNAWSHTDEDSASFLVHHTTEGAKGILNKATNLLNVFN